MMNIRVCRHVLAIFVAYATVLIAVPAEADPEQFVREARTVTIDGSAETWRLVWDGQPGSICGPDEVYMVVTCPCSGWAYAEYGKLSLVRTRAGREIERMDLRSLFGQFDYPEARKVEGSAYLQRWPMESSDLDRENGDDTNLIAEIRRRPPATIMKLADYDRDGDATEFLIQVGTMPCGKHQFAAVGITRASPHLHALSSAAHADAPLIMPAAAWEALLKSAGPTTITTLTCGDHASDVSTELVVSAQNGAIRARERTYSCSAGDKQGKLLHEMDQ